MDGMDISFAIVAFFVGIVVLAMIIGAIYSILRWIGMEPEKRMQEERKEAEFMEEIKAHVLNINIKNN